MRLLDTDVDLILFVLAVVPIIWSVQPPPHSIDNDEALVCHGTACYPAPLVWPDAPANQ